MSYRPTIRLLYDGELVDVRIYENRPDEDLMLQAAAMALFFRDYPDGDSIRRYYGTPTSDDPEFEEECLLNEEILMMSEKDYAVDVAAGSIYTEDRIIPFHDLDEDAIKQTEHFRQLQSKGPRLL
ncbi:MAG: hypothetical protein MJ075_06620 [Oscillospiraceae bacterium]|nr:hypothetical protein [Oscillospiraceae bacterium]